MEVDSNYLKLGQSSKFEVKYYQSKRQFLELEICQSQPTTSQRCLKWHANYNELLSLDLVVDKAGTQPTMRQ